MLLTSKTPPSEPLSLENAAIVADERLTPNLKTPVRVPRIKIINDHHQAVMIFLEEVLVNHGPAAILFEVKECLTLRFQDASVNVDSIVGYVVFQAGDGSFERHV